MSKKVTIANQEVISNSQTGVKDPLYKRVGSWTVRGNKLSYNRRDNIPFKVIADTVEIINTTKTSSLLESGYRVNLKIEPKDAQATQQVLQRIVFNERYYDHSAEFVAPDSLEDVIRNNANSTVPSKPSVSTDFSYIRDNFEYEQVVASIVEETRLVNYYEPRISNIKNKNSYAKMAKNTVGTNAENRQRYKNILVPPETIEEIVKANQLLDETSIYSYEIEDLDYTSEIPFFAKIKLKDTNSNIEQKQDFVKLGNNFLFYAENNNQNDPQGDIGSLLLRWHLQNPSDFISDQGFIYTSEGSSPTQTSLPSYSFLNWLNDLAPARVARLPDTIIALDFYGNPTPSLDLAVGNYENVINFSKTLNRVATRYAEEYLNSPSTKRIEDVLAGIPAKTEILYYKIDKFEGDEVTNNPVQTIVMPNIRETVDYLDTQVIYGKTYTYRISYVVAVHGCEYEYKSITKNTDGSYNLEVNSYPSIRVVEYPAFVSTSTALAPPPLVPRIEIVPIRRQRNKVKVVFYSGYGNEVQRPVPLSEADKQSNDKLVQNNFMTLQNATLEYNSISTVGRFEIYSSPRMPIETDDYSTFYEQKFSQVSTVDENGVPLTDSAAIVLDLKSDKKYYFAFVARNKFGIASNPTNIFEMIYTNKDGISRLDYKEYIAEGKPSTRRPAKVMTKLINIRPTFSQVVPNLKESQLVDSRNQPVDSKNKSVFLGATEDNMFGFPGEGKKFKFRFKSKKTNKAFDINVTCVNTKVATPFSTTSNSISLAMEERIEPMMQEESNIEFAGSVTTPIISISNYKDYNILEDQNLTTQVKRVIPIKEDQQKDRKNIIGQQSRRLNDLFPSNN